MSFEGQDPESYTDEDGHRKRDTSRKRDGKRDKKEKGYTMFEEEDSEEEKLVLAEDIKSPSKIKKEKAKPTFKFPVRKEKVKEKEEKKDKESKKEEKEKKREGKEGKKQKKEKKKKLVHEPDITKALPSQYENPIFGVPLALAVERNKSHDGIELPAIFRQCIDYIEECGLACEGIYRISGVKSKVQHLKDDYNRHEPVYLLEHEPNIVASLLKQFLRDLPEPVLTTALMPKFEEASTFKSNKKKVEGFHKLIADLPTCNRLLLSWMIVHMSHVIELARENKMSLQNVSIVLSPTMQISHRVLNVLFSNAGELFGDVQLRKYVPPLKPAHSKWSLELPDNPSALEEELAKQESLLNQLHADLNSGLTDPVIEEQLWEVQRVVTQLNRKIKMAKKNVHGDRRRSNQDTKKSSSTSLPSLSAPEDLQLELRRAPEPVAGPNTTTVCAVVEKQPPPEKTETETKAVEQVEKVESESRSSAEKEKVEAKAAPPVAKVETKLIKSTKTTRAPDVKKPAPEVSVKVEEVTPQVKAGEEPSQREGKEKEETESKMKEEASVAKEKEAGEEKNVRTAVKEEGEVKESVSSQAQAEEVKVEAETEVESKASVENRVEQEKLPVTNKSTDQALSGSTEDVQKLPKTTGAAAQKSQDQDCVKNKPVSHSAETEMGPEISPPEAPAPSRKEPSPISPAVEEKTPESPALPAFMSTTPLEPVKARIVVKPRKEEEDPEVIKENRRRSEQLRELEEELLGEKKKKKKKVVIVEDAPPKESSPVSVKVEEVPEPPPAKQEELPSGDLEYDKLIEEEDALKMEEEELLAIADELRQKIATERSEMERLTQEITELQYLRQDSDLEDLSSDSNSSDDSEDEDDLQELLSQLIRENQDLETSTSDMCQKIHEERMICLSVKLQIRLLQQKQLESSYG